MGMDIVDTILAERRANRIAAAVDKSEYWQSNYEALLDKYNALVRQYDHDVAQGNAEFDAVADIIRNNLDSLPISRDEINKKIQEARDKAAEKFPL